MKSLRLIAAAALLLAGIAHAQTAGTIAFAVTPTNGNASVSPTATWSTTPAATSCTASGGWTGTLAGSGTMSLATVIRNTSYTITCAWAGTLGKATLTWTLPTTNTNGTVLTDLAGFHVFFGKAAGTLDQEAIVGGATATTVDIPELLPGTWFFAVASTNAKGLDGPLSTVVSKTIAGTPPATASKTVAVTVNPVPSPPTGITVIEKTAYYVRPDEHRWAFLRGDRYDGKVKLGAACDELRATVDGYNVIARPSRAVTPTPPTGTVLVARCG